MAATGPRRVRLNANAVWERLNRRNLAQNEVARAVGITSGYLSQLLSGTRRPSPRVQARLMKELGIKDPEEIFLPDCEPVAETQGSEPPRGDRGGSACEREGAPPQ